jgi:hypothetical protein
MIISGEHDAVVSRRQMDELIRVAGSRGARILEDKEFGHPYQDSPKTHQRRQKEVAAFLLQE